MDWGKIRTLPSFREACGTPPERRPQAAPRRGTSAVLTTLAPARSAAIRAASTLCALAALWPPDASAQSLSNGPLTYEEGSPLQRVSYTPMMEGAELVQRGRVVAEVWLGLSNIFEQDSSATHVLFLDLERLTSAFTVRWGVTDRLELGGRLVMETTGPGVLDGFIVAWHDAFGFGQANRDRFPEGAYAQQLSDGNGTRFLDVPRRTLGFEGARLFAKWEAARSADGRDMLSLNAAVRIPGGRNLVADERADVALAALVRVGFSDRWHMHGMLGASTVRASPELAPILSGASTFLALAVERSFGGVSAVAQYQVQSAVMNAFDHRELDTFASNLVLGASGRVGERWRWDASFQEDVPADTPAVDFTLGLRVSRSW